MTIPSIARTVLALGGGFMALAVMLGAFGAHGLKHRLDEALMAVYQTGVQYHVYHALGLILVGLSLCLMPDNRLLRSSAWLLCGGIVIFSGSLYILALSGIKWLGAITPIGGLAFIAAWICFVVGVLRG